MTLPTFASAFLIGGQSAGVNQNTIRVGPWCATNSNNAGSDMPLPFAGVLTDVICHVNTAPGAGKSWTVTVYINNAATAFTCTIADTDDRETIAGPITLAAGDELAFLFTANNTPAAAVKHWCGIFTRSA